MLGRQVSPVSYASRFISFGFSNDFILDWFHEVLMWIFRTRQEIDTDALGTTDIRVIRQEERRLEDIYQKEIESFINHLR